MIDGDREVDISQGRHYNNNMSSGRQACFDLYPSNNSFM